MSLRLEGTYTALVTPFRDEPGQPVDWAALDALVDAQIAGGVTGLVPCGTTGESPTLSHEEHGQVVERVVERAGKRPGRRAQVIAGAGSNSTGEAVGLAQHAERAGVDAVMVVVPYYNKPTQQGLYRHFVEVAASVNLPVVIYNIPARTGVDLAPETLARICASAPNVVAVKESTGNVLRAQKHAQTMGDRSNVLPAEVSRATRLALDGKLDEARRAHLALMPVHEAMFLEANPGPVKAALAMRGVMKAAVRSPLVQAEESTRTALAAALDAYAKCAR
jgi:4-hydroxy-tetrahydrodipicolinate synthase